MKLLIATFTLTFASTLALAGTAPALKRLSCVASNGTTFETVGRRAAGVAIETRFGLFTRDFTAALVIEDETEQTTVELTDENERVAYLLDLTIDLATHKKQTRVGTVIRTGNGYVPAAVVATTICDLTLR